MSTRTVCHADARGVSQRQIGFTHIIGCSGHHGLQIGIPFGGVGAVEVCELQRLGLLDHG